MHKNPATQEMIDEVFTFHPANSERKTPERYESIRDRFREMATFINSECPDSREKSLAVTHLQEAMMFTVAAIAIHD